jgi:hypothetical protein
MLPRPHPGVLFQSLPDGAVLLDTRSEVYFGLNATGARIWQLLPPATHTLDALCTALAADYPDADPGTLRADAAALLDTLHEAGLTDSAPLVEKMDDAELAANAA